MIQINEENIYIIRSKLKPIGSLFKKPCNSKDYMIQIVMAKFKIYYKPIKDLQMKMWIIKYNNNINNCSVVYPINHTFITVN